MLVEIIGLPGSGKSYLLKYLKENSFISKNWRTWENEKVFATLEFIEKNELPMSQNKKSIIKILLKIPFTRNIITEYMLLKKVKYSTAMYEDDWGEFSNQVINGIQNRVVLKNCMKPHYINWELEKLMRAHLLMDYLEFNKKCVLLDEGFLTVLSTIENINEEDMNLYKGLLPNAIIFLDTDLNEVVRVARLRCNEGRQVQLIDKTEDEIRMFYGEKLCRYRKIIDFIRKENILVYEHKRGDDMNNVVNWLKEIGIMNSGDIA